VRERDAGALQLGCHAEVCDQDGRSRSQAWGRCGGPEVLDSGVYACAAIGRM
jgi:hypothetical protein